MPYKFENIDIIDSLEKIMKQNTQHYQSDFECDKAIISEAAASTNSQDKQLLWFSRPCGTTCSKEKNVFMQDLDAHNNWKFYGEHTNDTLLAYAIEIKKQINGKIIGNLYELDYQQHFKHVIDVSVTVGKVDIFYNNKTDFKDTIGLNELNDYLLSFKNTIQKIVYHPQNPELFRAILQQEHDLRDKLPKGNILQHIANLEKQKNKGTKKSVLQKLQDSKTKVQKQSKVPENEKSQPDL